MNNLYEPIFDETATPYMRSESWAFVPLVRRRTKKEALTKKWKEFIGLNSNEGVTFKLLK